MMHNIKRPHLGLLFLLALFVSSSLQYGVVYVDTIIGNRDLNEVVIENVVLTNESASVEYIQGLNSSGLTVNNINFAQGTETAPGNVGVGGSATAGGPLSANGGLDISNGAFTVDTNGNINTTGEVTANGINVSNGVFTVDSNGNVVLSSAPLHPNGGIQAPMGFSVDAATGNTNIGDDLYVEGNIYIGDTTGATRSILRVPAVGNFGGSTYLVGQASTIQGGNLILEPGYGSSATTAGEILLGRSQNDNIYFGRVSIQNKGGFAGATNVLGQSTANGNGGNIYLQSGNSATGFAGADVVLSPGYSSGNGVAGSIILGTNDCTNALCNNDLTMTRVNVGGAAAGDLIFSGQTSTTGIGGDLIISSGSGSFQGGDLYLEPGFGNNLSGKIYLGSLDNSELAIGRPSTTSPGGPLVFYGQDATLQSGGDIWLEAGSNLANPALPGDLYITSGDTSDPSFVTEIIFGTSSTNLIIQRQDGDTTATTIAGQTSTLASGGDLVFTSGSSNAYDAGTLTINSGDNGITLPGGNVNITAGPAVSNNGAGGSFYVTAGNGGGQGGSIYLNGGDDQINQGGSVNLITGGSGSRIIVASANTFEVLGQVTITNGHSLYITGDSSCVGDVDPVDCVTQTGLEVDNPLSSDGIFDAVLSILDPTESNLPRRVVGDSLVYVPAPPTVADDYTVYFTQPGGNYFQILQNLAVDIQLTMIGIVDALGQCGHGLIDVSLTDGTNAYLSCDATVPMAYAYLPSEMNTIF